MNKKAQLDPSEPLYRSVFQHSAVSLWIQDISELREMIRAWRRRGVKDLRSYLTRRPEKLREAVHSIRVLDVNDATLAMYEVKDKNALLVPLDETLDLDDPIAAENLIGDIVSIAENREQIEKESTAVSPSGKHLEVQIKIYVPPEDSPHPYMLVNVIDITERKRLEREIERDRNLYHTLIDNLPDAVYLKDTERRFLVANQATADLLGVESPNDLLGRRDRDFSLNDTANASATEEEALLRTGQGTSSEEEVTTSSGHRRWTLATKAAVRDASGRVTGLVGITKDITELRAVEQALRVSEQRYRSVFERAPIGIFHSTADGKLIDANPTFASSLGFASPEELRDYVIKHGMKALYADPRERSRLVKKISKAKSWQPSKWSFRRKDGETGTGRIVVRPFLDDKQRSVRFEVFMEDVTEQEAVQRSLSYERSLYTALMDNILDRIFFKDTDGRYTLVNRAQARAVGEHSTEALVGKHDSDYFPPDYAASARSAEQQVLATGNPLVETEELIRSPGAPDTWLLTTRMVLRDAAGQAVGTFGVSRDITNRKLVQARLIRSERLESLGQLAEGIAHQFNNINAALLVRVEALLRHPDLPGSSRSHLESMLVGIQRSAEITSRLEVLTLGTDTSMQSIVLADLLPQIVRSLRKRLSQSGITVKSRLLPVSPIRASESLVRYAVSSVVSNSVDALIHRTGGVIHISTIATAGAAGIVVEDNGPGIAEEDLPKIFTPFYTTKGEWAKKDSSQSAVGGIGLSLALTHSLVKEIGGSVEVESKEDVGTTVRVLFPLA